MVHRKKQEFFFCIEQSDIAKVLCGITKTKLKGVICDRITAITTGFKAIDKRWHT